MKRALVTLLFLVAAAPAHARFEAPPRPETRLGGLAEFPEVDVCAVLVEERETHQVLGVLFYDCAAGLPENPYAYVGFDPINFSDPWGLKPKGFTDDDWKAIRDWLAQDKQDQRAFDVLGSVGGGGDVTPDSNPNPNRPPPGRGAGRGGGGRPNPFRWGYDAKYTRPRGELPISDQLPVGTALRNLGRLGFRGGLITLGLTAGNVLQSTNGCEMGARCYALPGERRGPQHIVEEPFEHRPGMVEPQPGPMSQVQDPAGPLTPYLDPESSPTPMEAADVGAALPEQYWINNRAPIQIQPGIRRSRSGWQWNMSPGARPSS